VTPIWFSWQMRRSSSLVALNVRRLIRDESSADEIYAALVEHQPEKVFAGKELAILIYAGILTTRVAQMQKEDVLALKNAGCDDGEILEVNQVIAYFNYSNRLLNGLGVTTEGDAIGYYS
jgi:alkylhydroperoxidase family enzyme